MSGRVWVIGSANVDRTIPVDEMPQRGETVLGGPAERGPGGKGLNQAVASARMGVPTAFVGAVGADPDGDILRQTLVAEGIDVNGVATVDEPTGLAVILLEPDGSNRIVVSPGANLRTDSAGAAPAHGDVVVGQLEISVETVADALALAVEAGATTVLNAAPARTDLGPILPSVDVLVVNEPELEMIVGASAGSAAPDALDRSVLPTRHGVVVTRGAHGATLVEWADAGAPAVAEVAADRVAVADTTGAGDCFVGVLAAATALGVGWRAATEVAVAAATRSVTLPGAAASMPRRGDLPAGSEQLLPPSR